MVENSPANSGRQWRVWESEKKEWKLKLQRQVQPVPAGGVGMAAVEGSCEELCL